METQMNSPCCSAKLIKVNVGHGSSDKVFKPVYECSNCHERMSVYKPKRFRHKIGKHGAVCMVGQNGDICVECKKPVEWKSYLKEQLKNPEIKKEYDKVCLHKNTVELQDDNGWCVQACKDCKNILQ